MKATLKFILTALCTAVLFSCSEDENDFRPASYYHRMLAMEFTSINCTYCPLLAEAVAEVQNDFPGRISPVAFHSNLLGTDPMTLSMNDKIYEKVTTGKGLPMFAFDFRKNSQHIVNEYDKIVSELQLQLDTYKPSCGVAIESSFNEDTGKLDVTAKFISNKEAAYRYHIFLVEDGIEGTQAGHEGTSPYIHDNVLREISADNLYGSRLEQGNVLTPGKEYKVSKSFDIPTGWNHDRMRIIVSIMGTEDGSTYTCDNTNECRLGASVNYLYEKQ